MLARSPRSVQKLENVLYELSLVEAKGGGTVTVEPMEEVRAEE